MSASVPASSGIFISYRRTDTAYPAGWLFDRLVEHFGRTQVFKDVDSLQSGDDFVELGEIVIVKLLSAGDCRAVPPRRRVTYPEVTGTVRRRRTRYDRCRVSRLTASRWFTRWASRPPGGRSGAERGGALPGERHPVPCGPPVPGDPQGAAG
jgi:hypothetical protein